MTSGENSNLVTEFEQAYAEALAALCEEDTISDRSAIDEQKIVIFFEIRKSLFCSIKVINYIPNPQL
jgi:hypothetical protein